MRSSGSGLRLRSITCSGASGRMRLPFFVSIAMVFAGPYHQDLRDQPLHDGFRASIRPLAELHGGTDSDGLHTARTQPLLRYFSGFTKADRMRASCASQWTSGNSSGSSF